jgi:hypothetical protein
MEQHGVEEPALLRRERLHVLLRQVCRAGVEGERRHADFLIRLEPGVGLGARTCDPHLSGAGELVQVGEGHLREMHLEPAVKPHARFLRRHHMALHLAHCAISTDQVEACEDSREREHDRARRIGPCRQMGLALHEQCDVQREGGEGGEAAEDAGREEGARLLGDIELQRQEAGEHAHDEATGHVDDERMPRKVRSQHPARPDVDAMARCGADAAAEGNPQDHHVKCRSLCFRPPDPTIPQGPVKSMRGGLARVIPLPPPGEREG